MGTADAFDVSHVSTQEAYRRHLEKLRGEIEERHGKPAEQVLEEKRRRLWDAMAMKEPDRVPVVLGSTFLPAKLAGLPYSSAFYDPIRWKAAYARMIADFEPDTWGTAAAQSGAALDALGATTIRWPGGTLAPDVPQQNVDDEYMKEDEYDLFLGDFTDFYVRRYLPRAYTALAPLADLPPMRGGPLGLTSFLDSLRGPDLAGLGAVLKRASDEQSRFREEIGDLTSDMAGLGFPPLSDGFGGGAGGPAFDQVANTYRGWKGIITDMFRRPAKLIAAMEMINRGVMDRISPPDPRAPGPQFVNVGAIHRGSDRFLSKKQWETFYWPTWKATIMKAIELGYMVSIFAEGFCEERFEYFLDLPRGRAMIRFTDTNMFKAKEVLGDHCVLMGSVPLTLLQIGSPSEVDDYCRKLIEVCGKGGGYILRSDTDFIQEAKPENVRTMVDSVRKYRP